MKINKPLANSFLSKKKNSMNCIILRPSSTQEVPLVLKLKKESRSLLVYSLYNV